MNPGRCSAVLLCLMVALMFWGCGGHGRGHDVTSASDGGGQGTETPGDAQGDQDAPPGTDTSKIITASLPLCKTGVPYESNSARHTPATVQVKDGNPAYRFTLEEGSLPAGLFLDSSGVISGTTAQAPGLYSFTLRLTDQGDPSNAFTQAMSIRVVDPGAGTQPYTAITRDPRSWYVHQDASLCGQTSFYMIFKYLGGNRPGAGPTNVDLEETIPRDGAAVVDSSSKISRYFATISSDSLPGLDWPDLEDAAYTLRRGSIALYPCIQSNPDFTEEGSTGDAERGKIFENDLVPFLETNSPVLIHLKRPFWASGHYLIVIGYDKGTDEVLYLDPYNHEFDPRRDGYSPNALDWSQVVEKVSRSAFISQSWYQRSGYADARWDGRWLGFTH